MKIFPVCYFVLHTAKQSRAGGCTQRFAGKECAGSAIPCSELSGVAAYRVVFAAALG
jgi:hypothetical protein